MYVVDKDSVLKKAYSVAERIPERDVWEETVGLDLGGDLMKNQQSYKMEQWSGATWEIAFCVGSVGHRCREEAMDTETYFQ